MKRDINMLVPIVAGKCRALINEAASRGMVIIVTSTLRTDAEQRALYAQGRRSIVEVNSIRRIAGMPPVKEKDNSIVTGARYSMHQAGCAFDIARIDKEGRALWDAVAYEDVGLIGESLGLTWGGGFRSRDLCHFEFTGGLSIAELKAGIRPAQIGGEGASQIKEESEMENAKAGVRSTEFYIALLGAVLPVLNSHLGLAIPVSGIMSISGVVVSYILSRTVLKKG